MRCWELNRTWAVVAPRVLVSLASVMGTLAWEAPRAVAQDTRRAGSGSSCVIAGEWISGTISVADGAGHTFDVVTSSVAGTLTASASDVSIHVDAPLELTGTIHDTSVYVQQAVRLPGPVDVEAFTTFGLEGLASRDRLRVRGQSLSVSMPRALVTAGHWPGMVTPRDLPAAVSWWMVESALPVYATARRSSSVIAWLGTDPYPSTTPGTWLAPRARRGSLTRARFYDRGVELTGFVDATQIEEPDSRLTGGLFGASFAGEQSLAEGVVVRRARLAARTPVYADSNARTPWAYTTAELVVYAHGLPGDARWGTDTLAIEIPCPTTSCSPGPTLVRTVQTWSRPDAWGWSGLGATLATTPDDQRVFRGRRVHAWFDATALIDEPAH